VQVLHFAHPAVSIWAANQPGANAQGLRLSGSEIALILRDSRYNVPVSAIGAGDAALIAALQNDQTLLTAASLAALAEPRHDPQSILVRLMQASAITLPKDTR
jgi:hypothetical protein